VRVFNVEQTQAEGWQIQEERDATVVRQVNYGDWHRVELAIHGFSVEAAQLTRRGWRNLN
jgi:hypothetical protein